MDTQDIFDTHVGTLDVIIYAVLNMLGLPRERIDNDESARLNAARFVEYYGDKQIRAIKAIREVSGLNLRDSRDAWFQAIETYYGDYQYKMLRLKLAAERGDNQTVMSLAKTL